MHTSMVFSVYSCCVRSVEDNRERIRELFGHSVQESVMMFPAYYV